MAKHIALVAVSGTGKGTVSSYLFPIIPGLSLSISATTRSPRNEEKNGAHYYFLNKEEFLLKKDNGEFAEWNQYGQHFYGTLLSEVERIEKSGRTILFDVDINGALALKEALGDRVVTIFLEAPIEVCKARLLKRGTETAEYITERLSIGEEIEIPQKHKCDHCVWYGEGAEAPFTAHINC